MSLQYLQDFDSDSAHEDVVLTTCWTRHGVVVTGSLAGDIRVWDAANGHQIAGSSKPTSPHIVGINSLSVSQDQKRLLSSSVDGSVALWDISNVKVDDDVEEENAVATLKLIGKTSSLAGLSENKILHSQGDGSSTKQKGLESFTAAIHPNGQQFATTGAWAAVSVYSCEDEDEGRFAKPVIRMQTSPISTRANEPSGQINGPFGTKLAFSANGQLLAVGDDKGQVHLFDTSTNELVLKLANHSAPIRALAFSGNSRIVDNLFIGGDDCIITIHDVRNIDGSPTGRSVGSLNSHKAWITDLQPSADGRLLASSSLDGTIRIWDLKARPKACVCTISQDSPPWTLAWRAMSEGSRQAVTNGSNSMTAASASARDASAFVTGSEDGSVRWYRAAGVAPAET